MPRATQGRRVEVSLGWDAEGPEPDPRWQEELDRLFPPREGVGGLHIYWEPGYGWHRNPFIDRSHSMPVERWIIGRVMPRHFVPPYLDRRWFEGPDPAGLGYWDRKEDRWVSLSPPITRKQWAYWQEHQAVIQPYWVLQGDKGGHQYRLNRHESMVSRMHGGPRDTPAPGELPYAEPDRRTFGMLALRDRVRMNVATLGFIEANAERLKREERALAAEARKQVWNFLSQQFGEVASMVASKSFEDYIDAPHGISQSAVRHPDYDRIEEEITTGEDGLFV